MVSRPYPFQDTLDKNKNNNNTYDLTHLLGDSDVSTLPVRVLSQALGRLEASGVLGEVASVRTSRRHSPRLWDLRQEGPSPKPK